MKVKICIAILSVALIWAGFSHLAWSTGAPNQKLRVVKSEPPPAVIVTETKQAGYNSSTASLPDGWHAVGLSCFADKHDNARCFVATAPDH